MPQETLTHTKARSMSAIDSMTMSAPYPRVNLVVLTNQKAREKRSRYVDYRMRLPPELSANCVCRYGHRGITGTAAGAPRGSREVLPWSWGTGNESTGGDGSQRASALVGATAGRTEHRVVGRRRHRDR